MPFIRRRGSEPRDSVMEGLGASAPGPRIWVKVE
jgi:hypothetical protein